MKLKFTLPTLPWMSRADRRTWRAARTVTDLGELMARWLEGDIASRPGYEARWGPEDETTPLVPTLAALCRAGYITTGSQPGLTDLGANGGWWEQHAWIDLVVTDRALLDRLVATVDGVMLVRVHDHHRGAPAANAGPPVVATTCDGEPRMEVGARTRAIDMPRLWPGLHRDLYEEITHGWYVTVVAPTAGSGGDRLLWDLLDEVSSGRERDEPDWWTYEPEPGECRLCGAPILHSGPYCGPACQAADQDDPAPEPRKDVS
ncbi:hypothetical protein OH749_31210 (plasmid) [Streptomyces albidoflavus]|uniref:DUF6919 domain-containing protein n=1 Tax=Streptomyces albidoflavus TaxID=1886 RepID=UPI002F9087A8|nr:hypothetical protein OH749_31210 [Streptomyces albidoflavus]